jgi:hypothetical protein
MNKIRILLCVCMGLCVIPTLNASQSTPFSLSEREHNYLENLVCQSKYNLKANLIKAYVFDASDGSDGKMALAARTSAYVECESHGEFNQKPMRYIDECDLVDKEWDCSPPQLEVVVPINGRDVKMRPWGLTPEKAYDLLYQISTKGLFQGQPLDKAIGNSCDIAKTKDPEIIELDCEAAMSISFWCPQAKITGCPRVLFLSFADKPLKRR